MDLLERKNDALEWTLSYYREKLEKARTAEIPLTKLAKILQPEVEDEFVDITMSKFRIDFKSMKRAREVMRMLLETTEIEKFEKTMEESLDEIAWHYKAVLDGISVLIGPAPPQKKCKPIKKHTEWPYWVCETKGG